MNKRKKDALTIIGVVLLAMACMCMGCSPMHYNCNGQPDKGMSMRHGYISHYQIK